MQAKLKKMQADGVSLQPCVVCADSYGVSDQLRELGLGLEVKGMEDRSPISSRTTQSSL